MTALLSLQLSRHRRTATDTLHKAEDYTVSQCSPAHDTVMSQAQVYNACGCLIVHFHNSGQRLTHQLEWSLVLAAENRRQKFGAAKASIYYGIASRELACAADYVTVQSTT